MYFYSNLLKHNTALDVLVKCVFVITSDMVHYKLICIHRIYAYRILFKSCFRLVWQTNVSVLCQYLGSSQSFTCFRSKVRHPEHRPSCFRPELSAQGKGGPQGRARWQPMAGLPCPLTLCKRGPLVGLSFPSLPAWKRKWARHPSSSVETNVTDVHLHLFFHLCLPGLWPDQSLMTLPMITIIRNIWD